MSCKHDRSPDSGLKKAIAAVGGAGKLARLLAISPQAISQWGRIPPLRVHEVHSHTGIPHHELRPDLYPPGLLAC